MRSQSADLFLWGLACGVGVMLGMLLIVAEPQTRTPPTPVPEPPGWSGSWRVESSGNGWAWVGEEIVPVNAHRLLGIEGKLVLQRDGSGVYLGKDRNHPLLWCAAPAGGIVLQPADRQATVLQLVGLNWGRGGIRLRADGEVEREFTLTRIQE